MRITDLLDRQIPVTVHGRTFTIGRISLRTVLHILVRFADELEAFAVSNKQDIDALLPAGDDLADLYAFCLRPHDPLFLRKHLDAATATELASFIANLNDLPRIWGSLSFAQPRTVSQDKKPEQRLDPDPSIPPLLAIIDLVAHRYGINPMSVLDWPYESFLTITEVMDAKVGHQERLQLRELYQSLGLSPGWADIPGVTYSPIAGDLSREH